MGGGVGMEICLISEAEMVPHTPLSGGWGGVMYVIYSSVLIDAKVK